MAGREGQNDRHVVTLRRSRRVSCWRGFFPFAYAQGQNDKKKGLRMTKLGVRMAGREGQNDRHVVTLNEVKGLVGRRFY